jgi:uncharacterized damage-inducible protein DinB
MAPESSVDVIQMLEAGRQELASAVSGISEEQAQTSPGPGRWSALQCLEHLTTVEEIFLGRLEQAPRVGAPPVDQQKEADMARRIPDRTNKAQAPEKALPTGRFQTLREAVEGFHAARNKTVGFARQEAANLYAIASEHPRFGPLNGTEVLVFMNGHARRHTAQIREVRGVLGIA